MSKQTMKKLGLLTGFALVLLSLGLLVFLPVGAQDPDLNNTYYTVNAVSEDQERGTVSISPEPADGAYVYQYGTKVYLTATPRSDRYRFVRWEGDGITSTSNPFELIAGDGIESGTAHFYKAIFEPVSYAITIAEDPRIKYDDGTEPGDDFKHVYGSETPLPTLKDSTGYTFEGWLVESGGKTDPYAKGTSLGAYAFSDAIHLTPIFKARPFTVTIYDVPEAYKDLFDRITNTDDVDSGKLLNTDPISISSTFGAENVSPVDDSLDYYSMYRGYYFTKAVGSYKELAEVTANAKINFAIRYFTPKTFKIYYENCDRPEGSPETHTYGKETVILTPTREGYTFKGWKIRNWNNTDYPTIPETFTDVKNNLRIGPTDYDNSNWTEETKDNEDVSIVLEAIWEVNVYDVDYEGVDATQESELQDYRHRSYDETLTLPSSMTRTGYTFLGWRVKDSGAEFTTDFSIGASTVVGDLIIEAGWQANDYTVTLDPDADDATAGDTTVTLTFDQPFPNTVVHPTRDGYTFLGYYSEKNGRGKGYYYFDEDLNEWIANPSDISTNDKTLYAYWRINTVSVTVDPALLGVADVTVNGTLYVDGEIRTFPYNTMIEVVVTMKGNNKLVAWNGNPIAHTGSYTADAFALKADAVLTGAFAEAQPATDFRVDYRNETFVWENGSIPAGTYRLVCGDEAVAFTVDAEGAITFADGTKVGKLYAEAYLGKDVWFTLCGDGVNTADSDAQLISLIKRPAQPSADLNKGDIDHISVLDDSIKIVMKTDLPYKYEFWISNVRVTDIESITEWTSNPEFTGLKGGTPYYIYIRVAASDTYPHGEVYETERTTLPDKIRQQMIDDLNDLKKLGDGENVEKLIADCEKAMKEIQPATDFVEQLNAIYQNAAEKILFARVQDQNIEKLKSLLDSLKTSGAYSDTQGILQLEQCFETAKAAVAAASTESEVLRIIANAETALYAVPISYLFVDNSIKLTSGGMDREYQLTAVRVQDLSDISAKVKRAIAAGTYMVDSNASMTLAEAEKALPSLDVLGYYELRLMHKNAALAEKPITPFEIRLLIPEDLRDETGLLVAYGSDATGLTVLQTTREGNYLIFIADTVENFVILGDHTVNLTGLIVTLSVILLCQIAALAFLLIRRTRVEKEARAYSVALPVLALTVRFLPANSAMIVMLLGALVLLMQIVLLWLLFKSEMIFHGETHRKRKPLTPVSEALGETEQPTEEPEETQSEIPYFAPAQEPLEESYEDLDAYSSDEVAEEPDFADFPIEEEQNGGGAEPIEEDWYGDDSFIEPAAVPHYSLPDEEWDGGENAELVDVEDPESYESDVTDGGDSYGDDVEAEAFAYDEEVLVEEDFDAYDGEELYETEDFNGDLYEAEADGEGYEDTEYYEEGVYDDVAEVESYADGADLDSEVYEEEPYSELDGFAQEPELYGAEAEADDGLFYEPSVDAEDEKTEND